MKYTPNLYVIFIRSKIKCIYFCCFNKAKYYLQTKYIDLMAKRIF